MTKIENEDELTLVTATNEVLTLNTPTPAEVCVNVDRMVNMIIHSLEERVEKTRLEQQQQNRNSCEKFYIRNAQSGGKVLDVQGGSTKDGAPVWLWEMNSTGAQVWTFDSTSGRIQNPQSGNYLDVPKYSCSPPHDVIVVKSFNSDPIKGWGCQTWEYTKHGAIILKANGKALTASNNDVVLEPYQPNDLRQQWSLMPLSMFR